MIAENSAVTPLPASASNTNRHHGRVPPHHRSQVPWDSSAQQALLGSILLRGGMLPDVIAVLSESPDVFWGDADALVYSAMLQVYNAGKPLDGVTLTHQLQSDGHYDRIGGFDYLESLVNGVPSAANWRAYAEIVRARHRQRLEWQAGQNLQAGNLSSVQYLQTIQQINARFADDGPDRWPDPPEEAAYYGLAGDIVRTIAPHTESDPAAVLLHILVLFGNMVGRGPHFTVDGARHGLNIFAVCCGESSKARKGTAGSQALRLLNPVDPAWAANRIKSGLSSGEGMIFAVRDPVFKNEELVDQGESDKRLMALEPEFARLLKVAARDGNTVSPMIRLAWDNGDLHVLTRTPTKATGSHISIIGHITREELAAELTKTDAANGFGNRFLWSCVRRSKLLPRGGSLQDSHLEPLRQRLTQALQYTAGAGEIGMSFAAWELWEKHYPILSGGHTGLHGKLTSRAEAQVRRLACIYALLDNCGTVETQHLQAALALWDFCDRSAGYLFADGGNGNSAATHDPVREVVEILRNLGGRATLKVIRGKRRKFREAGVLEPIIEQAIDRGLLRRCEFVTDGPGAPSNFVELMPTGESDAGMMADDVSRRGIAVPVSVFPEDDPSMNSDTGTTDTTDTGDTSNAEFPPEASELDRVPTELEEANAMEAAVAEIVASRADFGPAFCGADLASICP